MVVSSHVAGIIVALGWSVLDGGFTKLELMATTVGQSVLAAFFVPAIVETLRAYFAGQVVGSTQLANRLLAAALVLASLGVSFAAKMQARQ